MGKNLPITDANLYPIHDKVQAEERLSFDDGVALYESPDITGVGYLAQHRARAAKREFRLLQY